MAMLPIYAIYAILVPCLTTVIVGFSEDCRSDIDYTNTLLRNLSGLSIDLGHILHTFSAVCPLRNIFIPGGHLGRECKRSCDPSCIKTHDCSPMSAFGYLQYACVDTSIFPEGKSKSYYMIGQCPSTYKGDLKTIAMCDSYHNNIAPVTSYRTNLTYRNAHCATCNEETVFTQWKVKIECKSKPPNLFRSSRHLETIFEKHYCNASFQLDYVGINYRPTECTSHKRIRLKVIYNHCNMTGLWTNYSESINWACANLDSYFYKFKNVFCYICNPSLASSSTHGMISVCNKTGRWKKYSRTLDMLCQSQPPLPRLPPFKNLYCLLCNGHDFPNMNHEWTNHMEMYNIEEDITETGTSLLSFSSENLSKSDMLRALESIDKIYGNGILFWSATRIENYKHLNHSEIKELVASYINVCGDRYMCATQSSYRRYIPEASNPICGSCSCNIDCVENYNCCPDFILEVQPYTCISRDNFMSVTTHMHEQYETTGSYQITQRYAGYRVMNKCSNRQSKYIHLCEDDTLIRSNFLSNVPIEVQDQQHLYKYKTYMNVFCFLCNIYTEKSKRFLRFNIQLHCNTLIDSHLTDNVNLLLNISKTKCNVSFVPSQRQYCKSQHVGHLWTDSQPNVLTYLRNDSDPEPIKTAIEYSQCNQTRFWGKYIQEINEVCEGLTESILALSIFKFNSKIYKNFACFVCNPDTPSSDYDNITAISTCVNANQRNASQFASMQCMERSYDSTWLPFKNFFCADCNLPPLIAVPLLIKPGETPTAQSSLKPGQTPTVRPWETDGTLRFLFSIHQNKWLELKTHTRIVPTTHQCDNSTYGKPLNSCRQLYCDEDRVLENWTCILHSEVAENIDYVFTVLLTQVNTARYRQIEGSNQTLWLPKVCQDVPAEVTEMLRNSTDFIVLQCNVSTNTECNENKTVLVANISHVVVSFYVEIISTDQLTNVERYLVSALNKVYIVRNWDREEFTFESKPLIELHYGGIWNKGTTGCMVHFDDFDDNSKGQGNLTYEPYVVSRLLFCPQVALTRDEFELDEELGCVIFKLNGLNKSEYEFKLSNSSVRICQYQQELVYMEDQSSNDKLLQAYKLFSIVCISLSLFGLLLTFLTYCTFANLRTTPGKNIMTLSFNMFMAQFILEFGYPLGKNKLLCTVSGVLSHYFWLATFFAMNVCSFHSFKTFCINFYEIHHQNRFRRPWVKYVCYTQGAALAFIVVTIGVHLATSRGTFIGYGKVRCFLADTYSIILSFLVPSATVFVINIAFFIAVFHKIRSTPDMLDSSAKRDILVFLRLCAIVGVSWPLQVIDGVFDFSIFSFFAAAFNGLQGVYICISYVCNIRVLRLYTSMVSRWRHTSDKSSGDTGMEFQNRPQST